MTSKLFPPLSYSIQRGNLLHQKRFSSSQSSTNAIQELWHYSGAKFCREEMDDKSIAVSFIHAG